VALIVDCELELVSALLKIGQGSTSTRWGHVRKSCFWNPSCAFLATVLQPWHQYCMSSVGELQRKVFSRVRARRAATWASLTAKPTLQPPYIGSTALSRVIILAAGQEDCLVITRTLARTGCHISVERRNGSAHSRSALSRIKFSLTMARGIFLSLHASRRSHCVCC
jgi:hypothetical protein